MTSCTVEIRKNETGEIHIDRNLDWHGEFIWVHGNFSCDCNRSIFFGDAPADTEEIECSEGKYSVRITADSGEELYSEFGE